ncbi:hypothetical protein [Clavibacter michiganensis]|uniref:hypothetical protein n=1 Tax=Clavibacter michiganensis TaxID=28447 RepID=UPI000A3AD08F|nr:hypothetical protein [Clavibacter michiganensis]OUD92856.1 hypothetical protein CMMCAS05_06900 [Clavibacter michiganensis subsp. michiganensis]OUE14379.1 hypothetical protein CMMCAY01_15370 [Clavibacter michiganensis subsp. michiganensis]UOW03596.1 hypothetical protein MU580_15270 [Clavibacter michiganensis subsp. michiganensis]
MTREPEPEHPHHPHARYHQGAWRVQVASQPVLGYVVPTVRAAGADPACEVSVCEASVFEIFADAVDDSGRRVWVSTAVTLEDAVAWMREHDMELLSFAGEHARRRRELATGMLPTHY